MKAKARIAALFNRPGTGRDADGIASASRVSTHVNGSGAPSRGRARLAFAFTTSAWLIAAAAILLTSAAPAAAGEGCANEARREEQGVFGTSLPDCRAYELVNSPRGPEPFFTADQGGANENLQLNIGDGAAWDARAAVDGNRFAFYTRYGPPPGSPSPGPYFLSTRTASGWTQQDVIPPFSVQQTFLCNPQIGAAEWSSDLSTSILSIGDGQQNEKYVDENDYKHCGHDEPLLDPNEPLLVQNIFLRDSETGSYTLLDVNQPEVPRNAWFEGGSADLSHVLFSSAAKLTPEAPTPPAHAAGSYSVGEDLYENLGGALRLVTILPDGNPVWGLLANGGEGFNRSMSEVTKAVSADGERVFFNAEGNLYLRENAGREPTASGECSQAEPAKACTVQVDLAAAGAPGPGGGSTFQWASADGSKVFFTDENRLTAGSTAEAGKPDLYEYDVERPEGSRLADLTPNAGEPADVQGLSGISEDGAYVYFAAEGVLTGNQENEHHEKAAAGEPNLYLRHAGATTYIATLLPTEPVNHYLEDTLDWSSAGLVGLTARVSPNGRFLAFDSLKSLTGFDNTPVDPSVSKGCSSGEKPEPCQEIFLYEADANKLSCASCAPSGARPVFPTSIRRSEQNPQNAITPTYLQRQLSDNGQVFFDTQNQLLPAAVNDSASEPLKNRSNVYEYEQGRLHLLSTGTSPESSYFYDAGASGNDVFILTAQALVGADGDATTSLYDARIGGGFPEPLIPPCEAEGCRPAYPGAPASASPASASFEGKGNVHPAGKGNPPPPAAKCKKGFVKKTGKCVKQRKKKSKKAKRKKSKKAKKSIRRVAK